MDPDLKFNKTRVKLLCDWSTSTIVTRAQVYTWDMGDDVTTLSVDVTVKLTDCDRMINWHEFGSNVHEAYAKIDSVIECMQQLKTDVMEAYSIKEGLEK